MKSTSPQGAKKRGIVSNDEDDNLIKEVGDTLEDSQRKAESEIKKRPVIVNTYMQLELGKGIAQELCLIFLILIYLNLKIEI